MGTILKNFYSIILLVTMFIPVSAFAAFVNSVEDNGVVYFLFSSPDKIVRYDTSSETFLAEIPLSKTPTVLSVSNNKAYVGYNRELREYDLISSVDTFIRNFSTDVKNVVRIGGYIYVFEQSNDFNIINAADFSYIAFYPSFISGKSFVASELQSAFYYRDSGVSPSDIHMVSIDIDGTVISDMDSPYHGAYPDANRLFLNASENRIYDDAGMIYFTADLTYAGSLGGTVDAMVFAGDEPIVLRNDRLYLYNTSGIEQGIIFLNSVPDVISATLQSVYQYTVGIDTVSVTKTDISSFSFQVPGTVVDPVGLAYEPDFIESDNANGLLYLVDVETLSVFVWSDATQAYINSWRLLNPPAWVSLSSSHNRLYFGYNDGKITYFDLAAATPVEMHFTTLATGVKGLLSAGDFLFAADDSGSWDTFYSFSSTAVVDSVDWVNTGSEYAWDSITNRIYHYRDGTSPNDIEWIEIDPVTGIFGVTGDSPYHGSSIQIQTPIRISDDGLYVLNGAGQIFDASTLDIVNALSNDISDGIWVNGELVTITATGDTLQRWRSDYELVVNYELMNTTSAKLALLNNKLAVIQQQSSIPVINVYDLINFTDADYDLIDDSMDNCPVVYNPDQSDFDGDGVGDLCDNDPDADSDMIADDVDNCVDVYNPYQEDSNSNGIGDACEVVSNPGSSNNNNISNNNNDNAGIGGGSGSFFFNSLLGILLLMRMFLFNRGVKQQQ